MTIYFDNAATTKAFPEVVKVMEDAMEVTYGNPSAKHIKGMEAENLSAGNNRKDTEGEAERNLFYLWRYRIQ